MITALLLALPVYAQTAESLKSPSDFDSTTNEASRSAAIFGEMMKVIGHPRCMNCHPVDGGPRQGDDMHPHMPPVVRGEADMGAPGMQCNTCHGPGNFAFPTGDGSIPGHDPWHLAPVSMGWIGKTPGEICAQIKDKDRNGGRSLEDLFEHNAHDGLVGWGWEPGEGREPVPGTQEQFGDLTRAWIDTGAACPDG